MENWGNGQPRPQGLPREKLRGGPWGRGWAKGSLRFPELLANVLSEASHEIMSYSGMNFKNAHQSSMKEFQVIRKKGIPQGVTLQRPKAPASTLFSIESAYVLNDICNPCSIQAIDFLLVS